MLAESLPNFTGEIPTDERSSGGFIRCHNRIRKFPEAVQLPGANGPKDVGVCPGVQQTSGVREDEQCQSRGTNQQVNTHPLTDTNF